MVDGRVVYCELHAHTGSGQWRKKHRGHDYYFGPISDPDAALDSWLKRWPSILRGVDPARVPDSYDEPMPVESWTLKAMCAAYMDARQADVDAGSLRKTTLRKYKTHLQKAIDILGPHVIVESLNNSHFRYLKNEIGKHYKSPDTRADFHASVRQAMAYAREEHGLDIEVGKRSFKGPLMSEKRAHRAEHGRKPVAWSDLWMMLAAADKWLRPCILLGINGGYGPTDIAKLTPAAVDLAAGVIDHTRHKTGEKRLVVLWPETVQAITRVSHADGALLRTQAGLLWDGKGTPRLSRAWKDLRDSLGLADSVQFYGLRHTLRTVGGIVDRDAVRRMMGQRVGDDVDNIYDHDLMLDKVRAVSMHVRRWLFTGTTRRAVRASVDAGVPAPVQPSSPERAAGQPSE